MSKQQQVCGNVRRGIRMQGYQFIWQDSQSEAKNYSYILIISRQVHLHTSLPQPFQSRRNTRNPHRSPLFSSTTLPTHLRAAASSISSHPSLFLAIIFASNSSGGSKVAEAGNLCFVGVSSLEGERECERPGADALAVIVFSEAGGISGRR